MAQLPATAVALATTLALAAGVAEAKPHRGRPRPPAARPLLRATPAPAAAVSQPRVSASARPVCGNIATKGPMRRECTDAVGVTYLVDAGDDRLEDRRAHLHPGPGRGHARRHRQGHGRLRSGHPPSPRTVEVAANAASTEPLVAACRRGLP
jgi:hypothetical protein